MENILTGKTLTTEQYHQILRRLVTMRRAVNGLLAELHGMEERIQAARDERSLVDKQPISSEIQ